jgi:hypothetical protein
VDTGFFPDFAAHGFFDRLGGFEEAGECAVPVLRPSLLAAEQDLLAVGGHDGHDDGGIGTGKAQVRDACARGTGRAVASVCDRGSDVLGGACAFETGVYGKGFVTAGSAEGVTGVPVKEVASFGVDGSYVVAISISPPCILDYL